MEKYKHGGLKVGSRLVLYLCYLKYLPNLTSPPLGPDICNWPWPTSGVLPAFHTYVHVHVTMDIQQVRYCGH